MPIDLGWYAEQIMEEEIRLHPALGLLHPSNLQRLKTSLAKALVKRMVAFGQARLPVAVFEKYCELLFQGESERAFALAAEHVEEFPHFLALELTDFKRDYLTGKTIG